MDVSFLLSVQLALQGIVPSNVSALLPGVGGKGMFLFWRIRGVRRVTRLPNALLCMRKGVPC